jgi:Fe-S cluster biosynthesis and repair protein YggX
MVPGVFKNPLNFKNMKTISINVYSFDELTPKAQERAIDDYRNKVDHYHIWDDAQQTVDKFIELQNIGLKTAYNSWLELSTSNVNDTILNLTGLRARKFFINNFEFLYKRKYLKHGEKIEQRPPFHRMRKIKEYKTGIFPVYYSNIQENNDCTLTGCTYDFSLLDPIYNFIEKFKEEDKTRTVEDVLRECFENLSRDIKNGIEERETDEYISEDLRENGAEFDEDGKQF